jgi:hypothetical protein
MIHTHFEPIYANSGDFFMALLDRIISLKSKHQLIEYSLRHEMSRPHPDALMIQDLKLRKLRLKEEIYRCESLKK